MIIFRAIKKSIRKTSSTLSVKQLQAEESVTTRQNSALVQVFKICVEFVKIIIKFVFDVAKSFCVIRFHLTIKADPARPRHCKRRGVCERSLKLAKM